MTVLPQSAFNSDISDKLSTPLRLVARRRWRLNAAVAICQTLIAGLLVLLATVLILGHFENLWMPVRILLAFVTWASLLASAVRFLRPAFGRWNLGRAAMQIEQDRPDLHERLSSAIEIAQQSDQTFNGSPRLIAHLFSQAEADAAAVQPDKVVPVDRVWRWAMLLSPVLIAWLSLTFSAASRHTAVAGLYRVLMPWKASLDSVIPPGDIHRASPQITGLEIRCDYPAYTGLAPTVTSATDGAIQALVGTRVTLTIHTNSPVSAEKSRINNDPGIPSQLIVPISQADSASPVYEAQFTIARSGGYQIHLTNEIGLTNKDEPLRTITAIPDETPSIVITSPEPQVKVGASDTVRVKFIAKDDFGVAKTEALLQVNDDPVQMVPVNFSSEQKRMVMNSPFSISVADLLKAHATTGRTETITYQLRVTDNRDPDPQIGFSNKQVLKVDMNEYQTYQAHEEKVAAEELRGAIYAAINQLDQAKQHLQPTRDVGASSSLEPWRKKDLDEAAAKLPKTDKDLLTAAAAAEDGVLQNIAKQVRQIAENPIRSAADETAQADLNTDKAQDRLDAANRAAADIAEARQKLQKILDDREIDKAMQQAGAMRDLADAAQKQQQAADLMKSPDQAQKQPQNHQVAQEQRQAMHDQEQASQKLQQALQQADALRDPQAQATAQKLEQLIHKVDEVAKHQDATEQQTEKQKTAADIQQAANAIAQQQEALNQDIQKTAEQDRLSIEKAYANLPSPDQLKNIVNALDRNQLQDAHNQMNQSTNQLHNEARQLQNLAKANDLRATQKQQDALNKDQQAAEQAKQDRDAAQRAADGLQKPVASDAELVNAKQAADTIEKQAGELHPQSDQAAQDAKAAEQHAKNAEAAADQAAHAAAPDEAKKDRAKTADELNQAGKALAKAARENADAHKAAMVAEQQKNAAAAADAAEQQAKQQDALARAVANQQNALARVQNAPPADQAAQQQNQLVDQTRDAKKDAEQLEQQAKEANNPNVEARAKHAEADLAAAQEHAARAAKAQQEAAHDQQDAANAHNAHQAATAEQKADQALNQAADQQQQASAALAKARGELRDTNASAQARARQTPAQAAQEAAQAQQDAGQQNPAAAQQAANALKQAARAMAKATPGMEPGPPEPGQTPQNEPAKMPSPVAGKSQDSKQGISFANLPITLPASVLDLGITADQWAVLPPLVKKDLLNAAQQNGPPEYRQMMRDYFAKVATMQEGKQ